MGLDFALHILYFVGHRFFVPVISFDCSGLARIGQPGEAFGVFLRQGSDPVPRFPFYNSSSGKLGFPICGNQVLKSITPLGMHKCIQFG
ncbi:hypothetical protein D3C75_1044690 [compost metagenome]